MGVKIDAPFLCHQIVYVLLGILQIPRLDLVKNCLDILYFLPVGNLARRGALLPRHTHKKAP